ncbi:MAG: hypothetical protein EA399_08990 [Desulfovibrionales bacterium]|nr:MAG: hypothetical protein EA399_08990 [Desulfovibrionales bacterium]
MAVVALLSLCKLVVLAVWSGSDALNPGNDAVAGSFPGAVKSAYAQAMTPELPAAWDVAQAAAPVGGSEGNGDGASQMAAQGDLSEEWQNLRRRQEEVQRQEQTLRALESELDAKLDRLQALETRIQGMIEEADVLKDRKIRHLVDVYSNMKPREAARALEALEEPVAVKILSGMRGRNAGEVLSFVDSERAARLTEALTRMHVPLQ